MRNGARREGTRGRALGSRPALRKPTLPPRISGREAWLPRRWTEGRQRQRETPS